MVGGGGGDPKVVEKGDLSKGANMAIREGD